MNIPTFINTQYVNDDFFPTSEKLSYDQLLNETLQDGLSNDGWTLPQVKAANISDLANIMPNGTMWYVTDAVPPVMVVKIDGSLRKVTTTAYP